MTLLNQIAAVLTFVFLLVVLSYYALLFLKTRKPEQEKRFRSITVIVPAHNEEEFLAECLNSVLSADFRGKKQVIVVDDGSIDSTLRVAERFKKKGVQVVSKGHTGKADSINTALALARGELVAVVDADSVISRDSLRLMAEEVSRKGVGGASCVIKVRNRSRFLGPWLHIEQLYNSLMRLLFSKVNANIVTPGPLSVYRASALREVGAFRTHGFSEDIDVTIRLIRRGYRISFSERSVSETNMPYVPKEFLRQRFRFARGMLNIFKKHLQVNRSLIDLYTLPLFVFMYAQAVIMGLFSLSQIVSGYSTYFLSKGVVFNLEVLKFFFDWFSFLGIAKWVASVFSGAAPLTPYVFAGISSTLLTYPLYLYAILRFDRRFDLLHLLALFFMFPFWLLIMIIYILSVPELFRKHQRNIWKKNE